MVYRNMLGSGVAAAVLLGAVGAHSAAADQGGTPSVNACTGRAMALLAQQGLMGERPTESISLNIARYVQQLCAAGNSPEYVVAQAIQKVREAAGAV